MPKKKGLGRDIEKSLESMKTLLSSLNDFSKAPLKRGLHGNGMDDEKMMKLVNEASEKAHSLAIMVEDLHDTVRGFKGNKNSRFASKVVENFLSETM